MIELYFGFHKPWASFSGMFGHVEVWGYTADHTWLFFDPRSAGSILAVTHHHDEVLDLLHTRFVTCDTILRLPATQGRFRVPLHGPMTCASICGHLVGVRALFPATLKRKLLAKGAEIVHGHAEGKQDRQGSAPA